jgi:hypothetical protein
MHLISLGSNRELRTLEDALNREQDIDAQLLTVSQQRADTREQLDEALLHVSDLQAVVDDAQQRAADADVRLARFNAAAVTESSPILGPNRLTAQQLADFVRGSGYTPRLTVSLDDLASLFIDESEKVGVRGDVAWAQSILETGGFGFSGSMVEPEDNNFAGIGACDSCHRGLRFDDARTGVRAQMQLLRIYADKSVKADSLPDALVLPRSLRLGFRGTVQSWADLAGTWASARDYGTKLYGIYERMVSATTGAPIPP